jgi:hypothetical protein
MKMARIIWLLGIFIISGCVTTIDVRSQLEQQVLPETGLQQMQFAYIGTVKTPDGPLYVAIQRLVLTGMHSPRGQSWLHLFSQNCRLVNSYSLGELAEPMWCEGSKIYLFGFGYSRGIPPDEDLRRLFRYPEAEKEFGYPTGNVIDFCRGSRLPVMRREKRYGSSGGIDDEPLRIGGTNSASESIH